MDNSQHVLKQRHMIGEGRSQRMGGGATKISGGQLPVGCGSQPDTAS